MKRIFQYRIRSRAVNAVLLALLPVLALVCLEFYNYLPWNLTVPIFLVNLLFFYIVFGICTFIFGNTHNGYKAGTLLFMIFGLVNYFVVDARSSPIVPWDLYSLGTAASVAGNYNYHISGRMVLVTVCFVLLCFLGSKTDIHVKRLWKRLAGIAVFLVAAFVYVQAIGTDTVIDAVGFDTTLFTPNVLYRNNGLVAGFLGNMKYLRVEKPEGYSQEKAQEIASEYTEAENSGTEADAAAAASTDELPNVIVIMNEAFSDLSVFGDFETDTDYMPFIHSLTENTVKGNCYVSVKGGNTANTEYEFLTGDSMAFLPAGSVPYQQYIKSETPSLASYLGNLGYDTAALHPFNASGWSRNKVYPLLGFDNMYFKSDFEDPKLVRSYISDESAFEKLIELYEAKEEGTSLFAFEVTMQNHGGYSKHVDDFDYTVHFAEDSGSSTQVKSAEEYLSLIQMSDAAFQMLAEYFEQQEEDTIILMFGDHQPSDYVTNVILRRLGLDRDGEDADEIYYNNYIVPFVMWANFDIEEEEVDAISANYLGGLLLSKAGIPLTGYQEFLEELRSEVPAITANMIVTADGTRYHYNDGVQYAREWISSYNILDYNHLADTKKRLAGFFGD